MPCKPTGLGARSGPAASGAKGPYTYMKKSLKLALKNRVPVGYGCLRKGIVAGSVHNLKEWRDEKRMLSAARR
jgi:hypothetical protein